LDGKLLIWIPIKEFENEAGKMLLNKESTNKVNAIMESRDKPYSRQLAAIMFTDMVAYTALMGEDEEKALELLDKNRDIQQPLIKLFNGRWIKEIGDGILSSFNSATEAVLCAIEIQKACEGISGLNLRIGIHLADVLFVNNDVYGDGVNIASRLESLAPPGNILISETVYWNIKNKKGFLIDFFGDEILKNVSSPIKVYRIKTQNGESPVVGVDFEKQRQTNGSANQEVLFDSDYSGYFDYDFMQKKLWSQHLKKDVGEKAQAHINFFEDQIPRFVSVERKNIDGRILVWISKYWKNGQTKPFIEKSSLLQSRNIEVTFEAKITGKALNLKIVFVRYNSWNLIADAETRTIEFHEFQKYVVRKKLPGTEDFTIRLEDAYCRGLPCQYQIQKIVIKEIF
jgi:class 3 adenylate cyclase